jgi:hypothetical protein
MLVIVSQSHFRAYATSSCIRILLHVGSVILDHVDSITDLGVEMDDSRMSISKHIDVTDGKALAMLGFRDPYNLRTLYVSPVYPNLEYARCVCQTYYKVHVNRIERVQRKFVRYAFRELDWMDMHDLSPYVDRCALIRLETLIRRRSYACVMFVFDVLSSRVGSPNF